MPFADVEIYIQKSEADGRYPVNMRVDGLRILPRGYLPAAAQPPTPTAAHYADLAYGQTLFDWLLADPQLKENWAEIRGEGRARRLRLFLDDAVAALHRWPWEALCEPARDGQPARSLAAHPDTPFARFLGVKAPLLKPLFRRPVRMLVVAPRQIDFAEKFPPSQYPDLAQIDPAYEFETLQNALRPLLDQNLLTLDLLPAPCSLAAIVSALSQARAENKGYHILHLICHGFYKEKTGQTFLLLANQNNRVKYTIDQRVAANLSPSLSDDENGLRLIFLASCESATRSSADAFRGLAPQLVQAGVPAVIAMQDQVGKQTAREFATKFYTQLLLHSQVNLAANEARQVITAADLPGSVIPVLFLRLADGRLLAHRSPTFTLRSIFDSLIADYRTLFAGRDIQFNLAKKTLFTSPLCDEPTLAAIADHITEICWEWQWL